MISYLPDLHGVDMMSWRRVLTERSQGRAAPSAAVQAAASPGGRLSPVLTYREKEPAGVGGRNDTTWTGERSRPSARRLGHATGWSSQALWPTFAHRPPTDAVGGGRRAIPLARQTGIAGNGRITVTARSATDRTAPAATRRAATSTGMPLPQNRARPSARN